MPRQSITSKTVSNYMRRNIGEMKSLPLHGVWTLRAVGWESSDIAGPKAKGCVEKVDTIRYSPAGADTKTTKTHVWRLTDEAREFIRDYSSQDDMEMPCGHIGFNNERDTDYYACKRCNGRWTKAELADQTAWCNTNTTETDGQDSANADTEAPSVSMEASD
jgi:hypothetical protein